MTDLLSWKQCLALAAIVVGYVLMIRQLRRWHALERATKQFTLDSAPDERRFVFAVRSSVTTPVPKAPIKGKRVA